MCEIDFGERHEQLGAEMGRSADADRGIVELARFLLRQGDELFQILGRNLATGEHDLIAHRHHRHRREIALPVVSDTLMQRRSNGQRTIGREI